MGAIVNADALFAKFRFYKVFIVLRKVLFHDLCSATCLALGCLTVHGFSPEMRAPGIALHVAGLLAYLGGGVQTTPVVSYGLYVGGRNQMTKIQLMLRIGAQVTGNILAFALFGLFWSFRFPGQGPFSHFLGIESLLGAACTFGASVLYIKKKDISDDKKLQSKSE